MAHGSERPEYRKAGAKRPQVVRHAHQKGTRRYSPRRPEKTHLYAIVKDNLEEFLRETRESNGGGRGIPRYVEQEFREYLRCGILPHGFLHAKCSDCGRHVLVSFSCKKRGACPSCAARRMCNTGAVVTDNVLPEVPVRQWVLSTPFEIRLLLAANAKAYGELTRIFSEEVLAQYKCRAEDLAIQNCRGGMLCFQHRFGGSLNLNPHLHAIVVDGVFVRDQDSSSSAHATFHPLPPPEPVQLKDIAFLVHRRFTGWLRRQGLLRRSDDDDTCDEGNTDPLTACLRGSLGLGQLCKLPQTQAESAGSVELLHDEQRFSQRHSAHAGDFGGFDVHAGVTVSKHDRESRERLVRYCARPVLSLERMTLTDDGMVAYRLRHIQKGRATHRVMNPLEFMARLSGLIPPPRHPLLRFYGVFAPHSKWRTLCVPGGTSEHRSCESPDENPANGSQPRNTPSQHATPGASVGHCNASNGHEKIAAKADVDRPAQVGLKYGSSLGINAWRIDWATLLKRTYDLDVLACACGGRLKFVELVTDADKARVVLQMLGMPSELPPLPRARAPDW